MAFMREPPSVLSCLSVKLTFVLPALCLAAASVCAQSLEKLSPEIDQLLPSPLHVEKVTTNSEFKWTEGPVWIANGGYLLFAEIPGNAIWKWSPPPGNNPALFMRPSGYTATTPFGGKEPGSNGMTLDARSRLTIAGHARRNVWRLESMNPHGQITVLADEYQGKKLNSPNDLVYSKSGDLYFTDPPYGLPSQKDTDPAKQLQVNGVYRIPHALQQKPGAPPDRAALQLLVKDLPRPNGIAFSPDERTLYIDNSEPKKFWMSYRVKADATLEAGTMLYDASSDRAAGSPDGMKVDRNGNIFSAGPGGVWIFSPTGKHLGTIRMPETVSNVAWGDSDGRMLYITASTSVYRVRTSVGGVLP
jgi:gluconolactonase